MIKRIALSVLLLSLSTVPALYADDCHRAGQLVGEAQQYAETSLSTAEKLLREAVDLCDKSASIHYNLGGVYYASGNFGKAQAEFEEALRLKPDHANAMSSLAALLFNKKEREYARALKFARGALALEPDNRFIREASELIEGYVDSPIVTSASNADAVAVVIGNRSYSAAGIPSVEYAAHDAETIKKYLIDTLGFREKNIIFRKDARYTDMLTVFGDNRDHKGLLYNFAKHGKSDIFIFYSGHGAPDTDSKKAFIAPVDLNPAAIRHTSYPLDLLYENIAKLATEKKTRSITIVLDACFSGASERGMIIKNASPLVMEVAQPALTIRNAAIITSSRGDQISSWYPEQKHGLFTYHFLKALRDITASDEAMTVARIEQKLTGSEGVNDNALRLHSREQMPQVFGVRSIVLVKGK
jgi:tetratricopeptide (TPR) repeat protein